MLSWFEKDAPIRVKFRALLVIHTVLAGAALAATLAATASPVLIGVSAGAFLLTIGTVVLASHLICTPYVSTVVRMEGLADGDLDSPIDYQDNQDCVGRMTKAMSVFRQNAIAVQASSEAQGTIVSAMQSGLQHLANKDLTYRIEKAFPEGYDQLRMDYNRAIGAIAETITAVSDAASSIRTG